MTKYRPISVVHGEFPGDQVGRPADEPARFDPLFHTRAAELFSRTDNLYRRTPSAPLTGDTRGISWLVPGGRQTRGK